MRVPLPTNRIVALTLVGALLTGVVAFGLALPGFGPSVVPGDPTSADTGGNPAAATADAPTPNPNFTPAVSGASGGGDHDDDDRYEEDEEHDEREDDEHEHEEDE